MSWPGGALTFWSDVTTIARGAFRYVPTRRRWWRRSSYVKLSDYVVAGRPYGSLAAALASLTGHAEPPQTPSLQSLHRDDAHYDVSANSPFWPTAGASSADGPDRSDCKARGSEPTLRAAYEAAVRLFNSRFAR